MPNTLQRTTRPRVVPARLALPLVALAAACAVTGCTTQAPPTTSVTVRIAPAAHPTAYEVQLHRSAGSFRAVHTMHSGERRTFSVPKGWLTVRIPGLCVVPTPGTRSTVIDVDPRTCTIA